MDHLDGINLTSLLPKIWNPIKVLKTNRVYKDKFVKAKLR